MDHHSKRKRSTSSDDDSDSEGIVQQDLVSKKKKKNDLSFSSASTTPKKEPKESSDEEAIDEEEDEDHDHDNSTTKGGLLPPSLILHHLKIIEEQMEGMQGKHNAKTTIEHYLSNLKFSGDKGLLKKSMLRYLTLSLQAKKIEFTQASSLMKEFLESSVALKFMPGFPARYGTLLSTYVRIKGLKYSIAKAKEYTEKMKNDDKGRAKAEKELENAKAAYIKELQDFLNVNRDSLSKAQIRYCTNSVDNYDKVMNPDKHKSARSVKKSKKEPLTAFGYFCQLSAKDYEHYEPEKREKKLRKKFDKLDDGVKEVYEKLARRDGA